MTMTPGQYLALRRRAAGLSVEDVAARISTDPRLTEIHRVAWIRRVEEDVAHISWDVIDALFRLFPFSFAVLGALVELRSYGPDFCPAPRICSSCGCSEHEACRMDDSRSCAWAGPDTCTRCTPTEEAA
ncbi:MAG TPA: helix-turn-helix transcriptional regulator [Sphingobium sp.]|uniref:helix-turn-helix domain-containing protein n=1 Tax=Sphingobium sp. TaxID=1912891 RepID=UPI002ED6597A